MSDVNWSVRFNSLSPEIRAIGCACEFQLRIQHLIFEKDRLKRRYLQSVAEINSHIKKCESFLRDLEKEVK